MCHEYGLISDTYDSLHFSAKIFCRSYCWSKLWRRRTRSYGMRLPPRRKLVSCCRVPAPERSAWSGTSQVCKQEMWSCSALSLQLKRWSLRAWRSCANRSIPVLLAKDSTLVSRCHLVACLCGHGFAHGTRPATGHTAVAA